MAEKMPTKAQAEVLRRMEDGDSLHIDVTMDGGCWFAGHRKSAHTSTVVALQQRGWITGRYAFPCYPAHVTALGRAALERYEAKHGESSNA